MTTTEFNNLVYTASKALKYPALKFTHDQDTAQDLIQETILKALKNKSKFKPDTNIKAWLYIIMKNTFISKYHRSKDHPHVGQEVAENTLEHSEQNWADSSFRISDVQEIIDSLEDRYRLVIKYRLEGYKFWEIEEMTDIPSVTLRVQWHLALKEIKYQLSLKDKIKS